MLRPQEIIVIDSPSEGPFDFDLETSLKALTGTNPKVLRSDDLLELSIEVFRYGDSVRPWHSPIVAQEQDFGALLLSYPLSADEAAPIVFVPRAHSMETALERLNTVKPDLKPERFTTTAGNIELALTKELSRPFDEIRTMNKTVLFEYDAADGPKNVIIASYLYGFACSAFQLAVEQHGYIIMYDDEHSLDDTVQTLKIIDSLRPIAHLTFVGSDDRLTKADKDLIVKVALDGLKS